MEVKIYADKIGLICVNKLEEGYVKGVLGLEKQGDTALARVVDKTGIEIQIIKRKENET